MAKVHMVERTTDTRDLVFEERRADADICLRVSQ